MAESPLESGMFGKSGRTHGLRSPGICGRDPDISRESTPSDSQGDVIPSSVWSQSLRFLVPHQHPMDVYLSHKKKRRILKKKQTERGVFH